MTQTRTTALEALAISYDREGYIAPHERRPEYAKFNEAIENFYGRGGRGMLRRIGKASFQYAIREQSGLMGLAGAALKLLPEKQRIHFVLNIMASALKKTNPQVETWVEDKDGSLAYIESTCAICYQRHSDHPICYLYLGSIGEAVRWATGADREIRETHCMSKWDVYCRFEIGESIG